MTTHFLLSQIRKEQDPEVQAILCQGVAKLVIAKMITDIEVHLLRSRWKFFLNPITGHQNTFESIYISADGRKRRFAAIAQPFLRYL